MLSRGGAGSLNSRANKLWTTRNQLLYFPSTCRQLNLYFTHAVKNKLTWSGGSSCHWEKLFTRYKKTGACSTSPSLSTERTQAQKYIQGQATFFDWYRVYWTQLNVPNGLWRQHLWYIAWHPPFNTTSLSTALYAVYMHIYIYIHTQILYIVSVCFSSIKWSIKWSRLSQPVHMSDSDVL